MLITLNGLTDDNVLSELFNNELTIIEDIQGSKIWVNWNGECFTVKAKTISSDSINLIDLAMQKYYNYAINYLNSIDNRVKSLLNKKWWFCFEYFPDENPANIEYNRLPKNNLVLTTIYKGSKYEMNFEEIEEYARLFNVDSLPIIFNGRLDDDKITAIKYFINTSEEDLEYIFGEKSFTFFFYKLLNPQLSNSFLMDGFGHNIEKLIIKSGINNELSFQLLNPLYKRISDENKTDFVEIYTLILVNFLSYAQSINITDIKIKGNNKEELYLYLVCKLFNMYISEVKDDILKFDFIVPKFFDKDKFKINTDLLLNKLTKDYIKESDKLEYIFKIILGSFNKKRKKPIGIFTENTVLLFNKFVEDIDDYINKYTKKIKERDLIKNGLLNFDDFFDLKYDVDGENNVYPDVFNEFEKETPGNIKKKKTTKK